MPRGHGFILVSFNIFINDLEEGVNSTLIIITSDAKLGFGACTKERDSERPRQEGSSLEKVNSAQGEKKITAHGIWKQ